MNNTYNILSAEDQQFLRLLREGDSNKIKEFQRQKELTKTRSYSFSDYIISMLERKKLKESEVAQRAGLSRDYVYKLIRGTKRTTERDYIIAICLALGMNYPETQYALELYPFPILDRADKRSMVIIHGLLSGYTMDDINELLQNGGYPLIRISPDMEKAEIGPIESTRFGEIIKVGPNRSTFEDNNKVISDTRRGNNSPSERRLFMRELDCRIEKLKMGCRNGYSLSDYDFVVETKVETDDGTITYVRSSIMDPNASLTTSSKSFFADDWDRDCIIESYFSRDYEDELDEDNTDINKILLKAASKSSYFTYFLKNDTLLDQLIAETREELYDTRLCGNDHGYRCDYCNDLKNETGFVIEVFNHTQPELQEYYQVIASFRMERSSIDNRISVLTTPISFKYSASHKSRFLKLHFSKDLHDVMYPKKKNQDDEIFINIDNLEDLDKKYDFAKITFASSKRFLLIEMCEQGFDVEDLIEEVTNELMALIEENNNKTILHN